MELFKSFVSAMAYASLGFSAAAAYLKINKVWKRKHNAEVANSVSIMGNVVDIIPLTFFSLNYLFILQWQGFIDSLIWIVAGIVSILIGAGVWVPENRRKSFWKELKEALKLERSEVGHLATSFFRPSGADIVLDLLTRFAFVDRELEPREKQLIDGFAEAWDADIDWDERQELANSEQPVSLVRTRDTAERYLATSPPAEQVAQLVDVLHALVAADETVTKEEALILGEVEAMLSAYVDEARTLKEHMVVIAPQNDEHDIAIATLLPNARKIEVAGGAGYVVGTYFSEQFAEMICEQYRALGFFTVDMMRLSRGAA